MLMPSGFVVFSWTLVRIRSASIGVMTLHYTSHQTCLFNAYLLFRMCLFLACCSWQMSIMGSTALMHPRPFLTWVIGCLTSWITVGASCFGSSCCLSSQLLNSRFITSSPDVCDPNPCFNAGSCQMKSGGEFECLCLEPYGGKRCQKGQEIHRKV